MDFRILIFGNNPLNSFEIAVFADEEVTESGWVEDTCKNWSQGQVWQYRFGQRRFARDHRLRLPRSPEAYVTVPHPCSAKRSNMLAWTVRSWRIVGSSG
jgi:hypothetical protein